MTDRELANGLLAGGYVGNTCPCGVIRTAAPAFHRRTQMHDCVHHRRRTCGWCRDVDRLVAGAEARLAVEVRHGPFTLTRWEQAA